jgi:hypothetical protein
MDTRIDIQWAFESNSEEAKSIIRHGSRSSDEQYRE